MRHKIFIRICFLIFVILVLSFVAFSEDEIIQSSWAAKPVTVDGSDADWQAETMSFHRKYGIDYAFQNDAQHLYAIFIFKDPGYMSTVKATGLTLWFNTEGKNKKVLGIHFKEKQVSADELIASMEKIQGPLSEERKNKIRSSPTYILYQGEIVDRKGKPVVAYAEGSELQVSVFNTKRLREGTSYEFRIPLSILENKALNLSLEPGKPAKVGFEWGGMTREMLEKKMKQLEGKAEAEVGEESYRREDEVSALSSLKRIAQKYSFWVDVKLAQNQ